MSRTPICRGYQIQARGAEKKKAQRQKKGNAVRRLDLLSELGQQRHEIGI
jgi:hypothetical protein